MKERLLFIYNPFAGKGTVRLRLALLIERFATAGYEVIVHPTAGRGDAQQTAREYALAGACERIVCAGGDGTFAETAGGLYQADSKIPLGYLPVGTTNDFAYSLRLPTALKKAAEVAVSGCMRESDIGTIQQINGPSEAATFTYSASFGLFTDVTYETPQSVKNALGRMAYLLNGAAKLMNIKYYHLIAEGETFHIEDDFIHGMIANSSSVGGFKGITGKNVVLDDGYFEMILIRKPKNLIELNDIINALMLNEIEKCPFIYYEQVSHVRMWTNEALPWSLDGDYGGDLRDVDITIVKQKLCYVTGESPEA